MWIRGKFACLFQEPSFLNYVGHRLHLDAFRLVDILERVKFLRLLVLYHPNLSKGSFANTSEQMEVKQISIPIEIDRLRSTAERSHVVKN